MAIESRTTTVEREVVGRIEAHRGSEKREANANPVPLALFGLGMAALAFGVVKSQWMTPDAEPGILVFALVLGGLLPLIAGVLAFQQKHFIEATAFTSMGAMWLAYYMLKSSVLGQISPLGTGQADFEGFFFLAFAGLAVYCAAATYRLAWPLIMSFTLMAIAFASEAIGIWAPSAAWTQFAGWVAVLTAVPALVGSLFMLFPGDAANTSIMSERRRVQ